MGATLKVRPGRLGPTELLFVLLSLAVAVWTVGAQTANDVTVTGTVTDANGGALPDAQVTAINTATAIARSVTTDQRGNYIILVVPGTYDVQTQLTGFTTTAQKNQVFYVGQKVTLDFTLQLASVVQTVEVQAQAITVPTTESTVQNIVAPQQLDNLPTLARSFTNLAALSPGVQVAQNTAVGGNAGGGISIGNAATYQTGYIVDGGVTEYNFLGGQYVNFAQDWIQEFSLISEQPSAQNGGAAGGYVNAITRSGGNEVHGRAYGFFENAALNASPDFLPPAFPTKPPENLQRIGGMIGGPIKKGKLFYFLGYEYFHNLTSGPVNVPALFVGPASTSGVFPESETTEIAMSKIDYQVNSANKLTGRLNYEQDKTVNSGVGASGSSNHTLGNGSDGITPGYVIYGAWQHTFSSDKLNTLLFERNRSTLDTSCNYVRAVGNYPLYPSQPGSTVSGDPTGYWAQLTYSTAGVVTGCGANVGLGGPLQSQVSTSATETFMVTRGRQNIIIGGEADLEHMFLYNVRNNYNGQYAINGSTPFNPATPSTYPLSDFLTFGGGNGLGGLIGGPIYSAFFQDDVKAASTLTLNLGIRYDVNLMNSEFSNKYIVPNITTETDVPLHPVNNDYSNVGPRAGFAWTPFHNSQTTVIRGGFGVFFDEEHIGFWSGELLGAVKIVPNGADNLNASRPSLNPYCLGYVSCVSGTVPAMEQQWVEEVLAYSLATYTLPNFSLGTYAMPGGPTYTIPAPTLGPGGTGALAPTTGGGLTNAPNLRIPGEWQASGGIEHQFGSSLNVSADYVYIRGFRQYTLYNSNITPEGALLNPAYGEVSTFSNGGYFIDQQLRVKASYRDVRGDSAQLAYTLGFADDNDYSGFGDNSHTTPQTDPYNFGVDYGPSVDDARDTLVFSGTLKGPVGFLFSPLFNFTSALPYNATTTATTVPGCLPDYNQCYPVGYTKNSLRGDDTITLNARLSKTFRLGEHRPLMLFIEGYNLLNRANFGVDYQSNVASSSFMHPTGISTARRQLQLGARFDF